MSVLDSKRFKALGLDWTARFDFNAVCELEELTGRGFVEVVGPFLQKVDERDRQDPKKVLAAMKALRFSDIRKVLFVSLLETQPEVTEQDVGKIVDDIGFTETMAIVGWAIVRGMPATADEGEIEGGDGTAGANPPGNRKQRRAAAKAG